MLVRPPAWPQVEALRAQLAEAEAEAAALGESMGGLERENSNLEAQVGSCKGRL